jgi:hypothetical protein
MNRNFQYKISRGILMSVLECYFLIPLEPPKQPSFFLSPDPPSLLQFHSKRLASRRSKPHDFPEDEQGLRRKKDHLLPPSYRTFDFTELDGKEKWTSYRFTKNVYDIWMPTHLKRICSVIDELHEALAEKSIDKRQVRIK